MFPDASFTATNLSSCASSRTGFRLHVHCRSARNVVQHNRQIAGIGNRTEVSQKRSLRWLVVHRRNVKQVIGTRRFRFARKRNRFRSVVSTPRPQPTGHSSGKPAAPSVQRHVGVLQPRMSPLHRWDPHGTRKSTPCPICQSISERKAFSSIAPSDEKGVTSAVPHPASASFSFFFIRHCLLPPLTSLFIPCLLQADRASCTPQVRKYARATLQQL